MEKYNNSSNDPQDFILYISKNGMQIDIENENRYDPIDSEIQKVCDYVEEGSEIINLNIEGYKINSHSLEGIVDKLINPGTLEHIFIDGLSGISNYAFSKLIVKLTTAKRLRHFSIYMDGIDIKDIEAVCTFLKRNGAIRFFGFGGKGLDTEKIEILLADFPHFDHLEELFLTTDVHRDTLGSIMGDVIARTSIPKIEMFSGKDCITCERRLGKNLEFERD